MARWLRHMPLACTHTYSHTHLHHQCVLACVYGGGQLFFASEHNSVVFTSPPPHLLPPPKQVPDIDAYYSDGNFSGPGVNFL